MKIILDNVNHPPHYNLGKIECIDFIINQNFDFFRGNIIKYLSRYRHKNGVEDLKKARWYLNKLIEVTHAQTFVKENKRYILDNKMTPYNMGFSPPNENAVFDYTKDQNFNALEFNFLFYICASTEISIKKDCKDCFEYLGLASKVLDRIIQSNEK